MQIYPRKDFLEALFGNYFEKHNGFLLVKSSGVLGQPQRVRFFSGIDSLADTPYEGCENVYLGVCPLQVPKPSRTHIRYITAVWARLDIGVSGHGEKRVGYESPQQAAEAFKSFPYSPSIMVESGQGAHLYWLLEEVSPVGQPQRVSRIFEDIASVLGCRPCSDLASLVPLPCTTKPQVAGIEDSCRVKWMDDHFRYRLEDFEALASGISIPSQRNRIGRAGFPQTEDGFPEGRSSGSLSEPSTEPVLTTSSVGESSERFLREESDDDLNRSLRSAALDGLVREVKLLLERGADINASDPLFGGTALLSTTGGIFGEPKGGEQGRRDVFKLLVERGADVNAAYDDGTTTLMTASDQGGLEAVKMLIQVGADVNFTNRDGKTALDFALDAKEESVADFLGAQGALTGPPELPFNRELAGAAALGNLRHLHELLKQGVSPNAVSVDGVPALTLAARNGHTEIVLALLDAGVDIDVANDKTEWITPLMAAVQRGKADVVRLLLERGADVQGTDASGLTALNHAQECGNLDAMKWLALHESGRPLTESLLREEAETSREDDVKQEESLMVDQLVTTSGPTAPAERIEIDSLTSGGEISLVAAARTGDAKAITALLNTGVDVKVRSAKGQTALTAACEGGHVEVVRLLLRHGADVDAGGTYGRPPLGVASERGDSNLVKVLLEAGAHIDSMDSAGYTPLLIASEKGHSAVVKTLLVHGADVHAMRFSDRQTALSLALERGHLIVAELLAGTGASACPRPSRATAALIKAARHGSVRVTEFLLSTGIETKTLGAALREACMYGKPEVVDLLLGAGACINDRSAASNEDFEARPNGKTPLMIASIWGHLEVVRLLLERGADLNCQDDLKTDALHWACRRKYLEIGRVLVERGANIRQCDSIGRNALHSASENGLATLVEMVLELKAKPDVLDVLGNTALMLAARNGHLEIVKRLICEGADVNLMNNEGMTALMMASQCGEADVVRSLLSYGAEVNARNGTSDWIDTDARTALMLAVAEGHLGVVGILLEKGADVNARDNAGWTALHLACTWNRTEIARRLLAEGAETNVLNRERKTPRYYALLRPLNGVRKVFDLSSD